MLYYSAEAVGSPYNLFYDGLNWYNRHNTSSLNGLYGGVLRKVVKGIKKVTIGTFKVLKKVLPIVAKYGKFIPVIGTFVSQAAQAASMVIDMADMVGIGKKKGDAQTPPQTTDRQQQHNQIYNKQTSNQKVINNHIQQKQLNELVKLNAPNNATDKRLIEANAKRNANRQEIRTHTNLAMQAERTSILDDIIKATKI